MDQTKPPGIQYGQIFVSEATFKHRGEFLVASPGSKPVNTRFRIDFKILMREDGEAAAGILRVSSDDDAEGVYDVAVEVVALVQVVKGQENVPLQVFMERSVPPTLYPFAREALASLTGRGRFGPIYLAPFNFAALIPKPAKARRAVRAVAKRKRKR